MACASPSSGRDAARAQEPSPVSLNFGGRQRQRAILQQREFIDEARRQQLAAAHYFAFTKKGKGPVRSFAVFLCMVGGGAMAPACAT